MEKKLSHAIQSFKSGKEAEAVRALEEILQSDPAHPLTNYTLGQMISKPEKSLSYFKKALQGDPKKTKYWISYIDVYLKLGDVKKAQTVLNQAISKGAAGRVFDDLGARIAQLQLGEFEERKSAIQALIKEKEFKKAMVQAEYLKILSPNSAEISNLQGAIKAAEGDYSTAINYYKIAIKKDSYFAKPYNNLGSALRKQGCGQAARDQYQKSIDLDPNFFQPVYNMALALQEEGEIERAGNFFQRALEINPAFGSANILLGLGYFLCGSINACNNRINKYYERAAKGGIEYENDKDIVFCDNFATFLLSLIPINRAQFRNSEKKIYHLGESHCLSYAHCGLTLNDNLFQVVPKITLGAKAYHFSQKRDNSFFTVTKCNLETVPRNSILFLSFGEIDCRADEGLISASTKTGKLLESLAKETVAGYVKWFSDAGKKNSLILNFFNIPAPVFNESLSMSPVYSDF